MKPPIFSQAWAEALGQELEASEAYRQAGAEPWKRLLAGELAPLMAVMSGQLKVLFPGALELEPARG